MTSVICSNCGEDFGPGDMFCEACGFEPVSGSVPDGLDQPVQPNPGGNGESASPDSPDLGQTVPTIALLIGVDTDYFATAVTEGEIELPDPVAAEVTIDIPGHEIHIGRTSETRAIHPDLDVAEVTGDPAVSSRHAVLALAESGGYTITDVGSTNGTFVGSIESEPLYAGVVTPVEAGTPIFVGAWTRITIVNNS